MSNLILKPIEQNPVYHPLNVLSQHIPEWHERNITPRSIAIALGYLAGRDLQPFEERDILVWMNDGIIGRTARQGEI